MRKQIFINFWGHNTEYFLNARRPILKKWINILKTSFINIIKNNIKQRFAGGVPC